ncbi:MULTISPECIES: pyrroline-5-carboxylate reductase [Mesorhizobium]|uniref:Pyrroline-5-carboxylate reductase n=1 Tax=Mesorhizobium denitrificans TaxID=2294114 RepID=A0A371XDH2_9HYPH|nr:MULTISPECIES: pyrroline-5-carboxylate reductase [Mesorhizobium]RFC67084.1 pyrroline-5-carboxylate reductase [Mesorhizobium denitrificans]
MTLKLVLVGCGNMGFAMLSGWLKSGKLKSSEVFVVEPNDALRDRAAGLNVATGSSSQDLPAGATPQIIVIAVKPQVIRQVLENYKQFGSGTATFVSIAAGTPIKTFEAVLGTGTPVLRCMPNTPAAIGKGMMVVYANPAVTSAARETISDLLSASGEVAGIDSEDLMDAVTAVSGSGPAYIFHFIECLTKAAEKVGLPVETARLLAMQTVYGAACLAAETREDPGELRRQVTSPNGTTAAALDVLMGGEKLANLLADAVEAARKRSVELGS